MKVTLGMYMILSHFACTVKVNELFSIILNIGTSLTDDLLSLNHNDSVTRLHNMISGPTASLYSQEASGHVNDLYRIENC